MDRMVQQVLQPPMGLHRDASRAGIGERDLEEAAGGDLVAFMWSALDAADTRPLTE
jgi:hypothetical protein